MDFLISLGIKVICAVLVVLIHEIPKEIVSYTLTHPIYKKKNGLKINPLSYIDPIGLIMFVLTYAGWQKPGEYTGTRYRNKEKGILAVAITGLVSNLVVLLIFIPLLKVSMNGYLQEFVAMIVIYNFSIIIINLLPVPPFEMTKIIQYISPNAYFRLIQHKRMIHIVFILLIAMNIIPLMVKNFIFLIL